MAKLPCAVCSRSKDETTMKFIETTPEERAQMVKMGEQVPQTRYGYCRPCWGILQSPGSAVSIMKGLFRAKVRAQGASHADAEKLADRFVDRIMPPTTTKH